VPRFTKRRFFALAALMFCVTPASLAGAWHPNEPPDTTPITQPPSPGIGFYQLASGKNVTKTL